MHISILMVKMWSKHGGFLSRFYSRCGVISHPSRPNKEEEEDVANRKTKNEDRGRRRKEGGRSVAP